MADALDYPGGVGVGVRPEGGVAMTRETLAYGKARERAGEKPDTQELILKELREIRKLLEEQKNEKVVVGPYYSISPLP